jgi:hypothetical protein
MFVYKRLKASDASITAFEAHKEYNINEDNRTSLGVSLIESQYSSASKDTYSQFNLNKELEYFQLDHLFYKNSIFNLGNLNGGINYINQEKRLYDKATIVSISQRNFGSGIQKGTVNFNSTYIDDSKGNLYNTNESINDYPIDKERIFYIGPVKGFTRVDLNRDLKTGALLVNPPNSYNAYVTDDSLYSNSLEYISCSFENINELNCTGIQLENGYLKIPHKNDYNFNEEDFSITFFYKSTDTSQAKYLISKGGTQTVVKSPGYTTNDKIQKTKPTLSASLGFYSLQVSEEDAGKSFPYEIIVNNSRINFSRADQNVISTVTGSELSNNTLYHVACVKTGSDLRIYIGGTLDNNGTDNTNLCRNQADLFIGANSNISEDKLESTSEGLISQLMIWNKGLSPTEIVKVSSSIDGTPYIGNVFYENGLITFTSPTTNTGDFSSTTNYNIPIHLNATDYQIIGGGNVDTTDLTFSGSFTFFNEEQLFSYNDNTIFNSLNFNSTFVSASFDGTDKVAGPIHLFGVPSSPVGTLTSINPIYLTNYTTRTNHSAIGPITFAIPGVEGTGSGEQGTDSDSITEITSFTPGSSELTVVRLAENQTVTESINILHISNSQVLVTETFPYQDTSLGDTVFSFGTSQFSNAGTFYDFNNNGGTYFNSVSVADGNRLLVRGNTNNGAYYRGQLRRVGNQGAQLITNTSTTLITLDREIPFNDTSPSSTRIIPDGLVDGCDYDTTDHHIEILETPDSGQLIFELTGSVDSITTSSYSPIGSTAYVYVKKNNATVWTPINQFNLGTDNSFTFYDYYNQTSEDGRKIIGATAGDEFDVHIRVSHPNLVSYKVQNVFLKIVGENGTEGFKNNVILRHSLSNVKANTSYKYNLNGILSRPTEGNNTFEGSLGTIYGLSQDINGNEVGVRVSLFQDNTLITSSLIPSSSGNTAQEFNFTYHTGTGTQDNLQLYVYPGILANNAAPVNTGYLQGFVLGSGSKDTPLTNKFTITEISGSNILTLDAELSDKFTSSANISSEIIFGDTTNLIGNTTSPVDILGFVNNDGTQVLVDGIYFATASLNATASLDRGNFISGSSSINLTGTKGLYSTDILTITTTGESDTSNGAPSGIDSNKKVRIQTKLNNSIIDTKYVNGGMNGQNIFAAETDKIDLGVLDNNDNISFEYTIVDSNNDITTVEKHEGFSITSIRLKKITSSNTVTILNSENINSNTSTITFDSPHSDIGDSELPFNTGAITASISQINGNIITLDDYYFITQSIGTITAYQNGPFIVSASYNWDYEAGKEYFFNFTGSASSSGAAIRLLDANGNIITQAGPTSTTSTLNLNTADLDHYRFNSSGTGKLLFFVSGASSTLYPDGIVTSSNINVTHSFGVTTGDDLHFEAVARSGSDVSSGDTITQAEFDENYADSNELLLTSSHTSAGTVEPILTIGNSIRNIAERTSGGNIKLTAPIFITSSSPATGSHPTQSFENATILAVPVNPFSTDSETNTNMIGGTFTYTDPDSSDTQVLTITNLTNNADGTTGVEVNNGNGLFQVGTYEAQNPQEVNVAYSITTTNDYTLVFKNTHLIFENEFHCTVDENEFNFTLNPTARKNQSINSGELANFATGSNFKPYVTTIGLYNEEGELLVIGKMAQPVRMSDETDTTFVVRFDT